MLITGSDENLVSSEFQYLGGATATPTYAVRDMSGLNLYRNSVFVGGRNNLGGIELRDGQRGSIIGCAFDGVSGDNVFAASTSMNVIANNTFTSIADQATTNGEFSGIHLEFGCVENIVTGNILESSAAGGRTRSLIRERDMGDAGSNIITHNIGRTVGTLGGTALDLNGTDSIVGPNIINKTIV